MNRIIRLSGLLPLLLWMTTIGVSTAQTTVVLPKSCKGCPISTHGDGEITSYNNCSVASSGTLTVGMSASAVTQTIAVTVGKVGTYNIAAIANGVIFSASGSFTATGVQNIVLTAAGVPLAAGTFGYTINTTPTCTFTRATVASTAAARGGMSCEDALTNVQTFGVQRLAAWSADTDGNSSWAATQYANEYFLGADSTTLYTVMGESHDSTGTQQVISNAIMPLHVIRQKFQNMKFKTFMHIDFYRTTSGYGAGDYLFFLNNQNELYAFILGNSSNGSAQTYAPVGPPLGTTTFLSSYLNKVVRITSDTLKFSSFWRGDHKENNIMYGYNPANNKIYSWGSSYSSGNLGIAPQGNLLRNANTLQKSITPAPATIINTILTRNNTTMLEMSDQHQTFQESTGNSYINSLWFIGKDGNTYGSFPAYPGNNYKVSLPNGVKAVEVRSSNPSGSGYALSFLGDDGKVYQYKPATTYYDFPPTSVDQPLSVTLVAASAALNVKIKQLFFMTYEMRKYTGLQAFLCLGENGKVYVISEDPTLATINLTDTYSLPLFSKIFSIPSLTQTVPNIFTFLGQSATTGNTIQVGYNSANTNTSIHNYIMDGLIHPLAIAYGSGYLTSNTTPGIHLLDDGTLKAGDTSQVQSFMWFNCYDPWGWKK